MTFEGHEVDETHGHVQPDMKVVKWFRKLIEPLKYGKPDVSRSADEFEETPEQEEQRLREAERDAENFPHS